MHRSLSIAFITVFGILSSVLFNACSHTTEPSMQIAKVKVAERVDGDTRIEVYADAPLSAGYNKIYVRAFCLCDGSILRDAHVEIMAEMNMSGGTHNAPSEDPLSTTPNAEGLFEGAVVCTMAEIEHQDWTLHIGLHNHKTDTEHEFMIPVSVQSSTNLCSFRGTDGNEYYCVLYVPNGCHSGMNDCRVYVYRRSSETEVLATDELSLQMSPTMLSMGHGSGGNVQPSASGNGRYDCRANLSMSGTWKLHFTLSSHNQLLGSVDFLLSI